MDLKAAVRGKALTYWVALALTAMFVALRAWDPIPVQSLRLKVFDIYQRVQPRVPTKQPVVIVDIDEESLKAYGQWPWPRTLVARLVDRLMALQAAVVGFDMVFAEPDRMSPGNVAKSLSGLDAAGRRMLERLPGNDAVLARALKGARVVLGQATIDRDLSGGADPGEPKTRFALKGDDPADVVFRFPGLIRNLPELEAAAAGIGMFSLIPEVDGLVRRVPLLVRVGDRLYPALTVEMLRVVADSMIPDLKINTLVIKTDAAGVNSIIVPELREIPTDGRARAWINYSPHDRNRYVSARAVLDGTVPRRRIEGHLVLVGTSAAGLMDIRATPIDPAMPGVEVHAQLLETMLSNAYLHRPGYVYGAELALLAAICLLMIFLVGRVGPIAGLATGSVVIAAAAAASWYLYVDRNVLFDVAYVAIAGFVLYSTVTFLNYLRGEAERRQVRAAFSQYLSPALVEQLVKDPDRLKLGGETKDMTILFCDIRGFTAISELYGDDPEGLTRFINRYLTPLTGTVLDGGGTIDKYMGDCVMAFWNAPLDDADHAAHGCASALAMLDDIDDLNQTLRREAEETGGRFIPIKMGFGLNSGSCCVGNMGSDQRFDYSVLGDDVNLAARLEGQSKTYGVDIVVGDGTRERAAGFAWLELDLIRVKGKRKAECIHTLLGGPELRARPDFAELAQRQDEMLTAYRDRRWGDARQLIGACRKLTGRLALDAYYDLYEERIGAFEAAPPEADWGGVYDATEK